MMLVFIAVFAFTAWAVLGRHFDDGIIAKHLLSFSSIFAFLVILDGTNLKAAVASGVCLVVGILYAYYRPTRRRPLLHDRRVRPRPF